MDCNADAFQLSSKIPTPSHHHLLPSVTVPFTTTRKPLV